MEDSVKLLDVVALLDDLPEHALRRGQIGTVVENLAPDVYLIEFSDNHGRAYAMLPLRMEQLMRLYTDPTRAA